MLIASQYRWMDLKDDYRLNVLQMPTYQFLL